MKRILYSLAYMAMVAVFCSSCAGNDNDLGRIEVPSSDYTLPQGKDAMPMPSSYRCIKSTALTFYMNSQRKTFSGVR